jgi:glycosyltransferase involved in cell wall biosynthesis
MGDKIHRLLDSIIIQTYTKLQVIIVDDGSTDNSADVIKSYIKKATEKGIQIEYVYRKNGGLGAAINTGLKHVNGDFFCWPDADDYLTPDSVEKKLNFLLEHEDYAFVRSDAAIFFENDLTKPVGCMTRKSPNRFKEVDLFEDYILEKDITFCPGCHMVRTASYKEVNPNMDIYEGRRGQNYQLLLPLLYRFKFGYIDECLYNFIYYSNSMSRGDDTFQKWVDRNAGLQSYILETLDRMSMEPEDYEYYKSLTLQKYIYQNACRAYDFGLRDEYKAYREKLYDTRFLDSISRIDKLFKIPLSFKIHALYMWLIRRIKGNSKIYKIIKLLRHD